MCTYMYSCDDISCISQFQIVVTNTWTLMPFFSELNSTTLESKLLNANLVPERYILPLASVRHRKKNGVTVRFCTGYFVSQNLVLSTGNFIQKIKKVIADDPESVFIMLKWKVNVPDRPLHYMIKHLEHFNDFKSIDNILPDTNINIGLLLVGLITSYDLTNKLILN